MLIVNGADHAVRLRYASLFFFSVKRGCFRASLSPQELRQGSSGGCGVLLSPRGVESHRFFFRVNYWASPTVSPRGMQEPLHGAGQNIGSQLSRLRGKAVQLASRDSKEFGALSFFKEILYCDSVRLFRKSGRF